MQMRLIRMLAAAPILTGTIHVTAAGQHEDATTCLALMQIRSIRMLAPPPPRGVGSVNVKVVVLVISNQSVGFLSFIVAMAIASFCIAAICARVAKGTPIAASPPVARGGCDLLNMRPCA
tara:strand:- start:30 stop:389 length:360 start_codon:yes stop_codon:yes gene_type:complete